MTKLYARFLVAIVKLATGFLGRWRRLTVLARIHARLAPECTVTVNGISLTLLVPDRTSVYWVRHGFSSEPNTLSWIDGFREGDVFFDVGANIGAYTLYAAKARSVRVVAFEPNPFSFRVLVHNLQLNGVAENVTPLCLAADAETGPAPLFLKGTDAGSVGHSLGEGRGEENEFQVWTLAFSLDGLTETGGLPRPHHLKIDVDGIELPILEGAKSLLSDSRLRSVLVETLTHDEQDREKIGALLGQCGLAPDPDWREDGSDNRLFVRAP